MSSRWNLRKVEKDYSERNWYYILGPEFVKLRESEDSIFWPHSFFHYLEAHVREHSKKSNKRVSSITYALASTLLFGSMMGENNTPRNPDSYLSRLSTYDKHFTCNFNRGIAGYLGGDITSNIKVLVKETAKSILQKEKERFLQNEMERFINSLSSYGPSRRDNRNWDEAPAFDYPFDGYISEGDDDSLSDSTSGYDSDTSCQQNGISYKNSDTESDTSSTSGYDSDTISEQSSISSILVSLSESDSSSTSGYISDYISDTSSI